MIKTKKLRLNRETLHRLDDLALRWVGGATAVATGCIACTNVCSVKCGTSDSCQPTVGTLSQCCQYTYNC